MTKVDPVLAIRQAFTRIVFAGGFDRLTVRGLVAEAGVARSTFYEHFAGKEDVLRVSMSGFFEQVADCVSLDSPPPDLDRVVEHLWENRRLTDAIFSGQARNALVRNQTDLVESRLRSLAGATGLVIPSRLAAGAIAEMQLSLLESWLRGRVHCPQQQLADGLYRASRAAAKGLVTA